MNIARLQKLTRFLGIPKELGIEKKLSYLSQSRGAAPFVEIRTEGNSIFLRLYRNFGTLQTTVGGMYEECRKL